MRFELVPVVQNVRVVQIVLREKLVIRTHQILPLSRGCVAACESENCHSDYYESAE